METARELLILAALGTEEGYVFLALGSGCDMWKDSPRIYQDSPDYGCYLWYPLPVSRGLDSHLCFDSEACRASHGCHLEQCGLGERRRLFVRVKSVCHRVLGRHLILSSSQCRVWRS